MARVSAERRAIAAEYARGCNDPLLADLLADLADAEARAERAEGALRIAAGVLGSTRLQPDGHEGDEETGEHFEDCGRCEWDAASAHVEEALTATRRGKYGESEADARLIAAHSPDVVRALAEVVGAARLFRKADTGGGFNDRVECGRLLDAALARLDAVTNKGG